MLDNPGALVSRGSLRRIAERYAHSAVIREMLLSREELPGDARHMLALGISESLGESSFIQSVIGLRRLDRIKREACEVATVALAGEAPQEDMPDLVEHLRRDGRLTPGFLMQALCMGKLDFFATAIVNLSGVAERRVRSIIADGRFHAARALYESAGLTRDISEVFVEATMLWRRADRGTETSLFGSLTGHLVSRFRRDAKSDGDASELIDMVEKLQIAQHRRSARAYASFLAIEAA
jgi:uncharacterized protein (DUF2336 family)